VEAAEGRTALAALDESLKALRVEAQAAQEKRSEIELELVKKQAELKYLDETSRKELNIAAAEVASGEESQLLDEGGGGRGRAALPGSSRQASRRWVR
jgi:hypothetical protein